MLYAKSALASLPVRPANRKTHTALLPVQGFVDDGGGKGQQRTFVLAGCLVKRKFGPNSRMKWNECLGQYPAIQVFQNI